MNKMKRYLIFLACILAGTAGPAYAQHQKTITGTVLDRETQQPVPGVNVFFAQTTIGTTTDKEGSFTLKRIPEDNRELVFSFVGYRTHTEQIPVETSEIVPLRVELQPRLMMLRGIRVTALQPDLKRSQMAREDIQKANPRDSGELLRDIDGVDAVRRGPVGLDPVIRGLRETEVGTFLDGTRIFPGGPARMDSPLSHLDPSAIKTIDVVKGPYALTWGAGTMSAVRVQTQPLTDLRKPFGGMISSGYDSNYNAVEEAVSAFGNTGKAGYWIHGAWRKGNNYRSGNGTSVPADFLSREVRGKLGYAITENSYLDVSLGYQNQENIDYPGRLLDAEYFDTYNMSARWQWSPDHETVETMEASVYRNTVDHGMNNDGKPTAQPDPDRMPPFGLDVGVDARMYITGGAFSTSFSGGDSWDWKIGGDYYSTNRKAVRIIERRDNGMPMFEDLMWPGAIIRDGGGYIQADYTFSDRLSAQGTLRLDFVSADADTASDFFRENISSDLRSSETNISGSATMSYIPSDHWTLGAGFGSVVRTADATERYSDRTPASKAQTSAEFAGNPALNPERSTQADLWISITYPKWDLSVNSFIRRMDNYITITSTSLPKRLPLSPDTVFQYINGSALFHGFDAAASYSLLDPLQLKGGLSYLWGEDREPGQPALGISPLNVNTGFRYESPQRPFFVEGTVHFVGKQDRVAALKGETSTDGYTTADLQMGATILRQLSVQAGVKNITGTQYVNHLNARNPFSGRPIPEPGRVFFVDLQFTF